MSTRRREGEGDRAGDDMIASKREEQQEYIFGGGGLEDGGVGNGLVEKYSQQEG